MDNIIFGIRPVAEAIEAGKQIEKLYIRKGAEGQLMSELRETSVSGIRCVCRRCRSRNSTA